MKQTVVCTNPKGFKLTKGKEYETTCKRSGYYYLTNDIKKSVKYSTDLFKEVVKPVEKKKDDIPTILSSMRTNNDTYIFTKDDSRLTINSGLSYSSTHISCGVAQISHINTLAGSINRLDLTVEEKRSIFLHILKNYMSQHTMGIYLFSTNSSDNEYMEVISALDELITPTEANNPNSGNNIKVWAVPFVEPEDEDEDDEDWDEK